MDTSQGTCLNPTNAPQTRAHITHSTRCCRTAPRERLFTALFIFPKSCILCSCKGHRSLFQCEHTRRIPKIWDEVLRDTSLPAKLQTHLQLCMSSATHRIPSQFKTFILKENKTKQNRAICLLFD